MNIKMPVNCPICNEIMVTDFGTGQTMTKSCSTQLSHGIKFVSREDLYCIREIVLRTSTSPLQYVKWLPGILTVRVETDGKKSTYLPWFEPDFTDYKKLLEKLKTYILFS